MSTIVHSRLVRFLLVLAVLAVLVTVLATAAADFGSRLTPAGAATQPRCWVVAPEADLGPAPIPGVVDFVPIDGIFGGWLDADGVYRGWSLAEDAIVWSTPSCAAASPPYPGRWRLLGGGPR